MTESRRTIAAVLAGGVGARMGHHRPKQLLELAGRPIIEHSVAAFDQAEAVDDVVVLMVGDHLTEAERIAARYTKVRRVLAGGTDRTRTSWLAITAAADVAKSAGIPPERVNVLLHDAVRPLVDTATIDRCVAALRRHRAVGVAVPSTDTVIEVRADDDGEVITQVPDRSRLRRVQTPQGFHLTTVQRAYRLAMADPGLLATDDCGVVLRYLPEVGVHVVPGSESNLKITTPGDLAVAEALLRGRIG
ncbi:IspD/TarI family cytidylyltransferase [Allonocardiopsis opalescens]|uniref:2-C-methyl-D-erythritol 4-phosphate cytidylyltransferase n=1 Tax=Allonocardiopsis opalescens TaxID=1144618 RepID=A0A2T0QBX6_9ACTN|nr:IspD/TarI family cytidylyltransferase [Allonocardiopsis opalescens]PRY01456.1 2-C-methyl-D-erythritol 4-phosphate cytidylyltransferase [Allonocardiopsis opalescens]